MCFTAEMSFALSGIGTLAALFAWIRFRNASMVTGVLFFVAMELLQAVQQAHVGQSSDMNRLLTVIGWAHICAQPFFTHLLAS